MRILFKQQSLFMAVKCWVYVIKNHAEMNKNVPQVGHKVHFVAGVSYML